MMRVLLPLAASLIAATPALANFTCAFTTECYEAENCQSTSFDLAVDLAAKSISTDFGDLTIVAVKETGALTTLFATGDGAEYLLSATQNAARLSSHANDGPLVITYLGRCDGAVK